MIPIKQTHLLELQQQWVIIFLYLAPEILNDDQYSFEADIYSLGCCLFFMITGQYPYFEKKKSMLLKSIKSENA